MLYSSIRNSTNSTASKLSGADLMLAKDDGTEVGLVRSESNLESLGKFTVQGDTSGCLKGLVDVQIIVYPYYMLLILKYHYDKIIAFIFP